MSLPEEVEDFLDRTHELSTDDWKIVIAVGRELSQAGRRDAAKALKPSASQSSEIERATRDALAPRSAAIKAAGPYVYSLVIASTRWAATALLTRDELAPEQYELLVRPFTAAGLSSLQ